MSILFLPLVLILLQLLYTFSSYKSITEISPRLDNFNNQSGISSPPIPVDLKYYDNKYAKQFEINFEFTAQKIGGNLFQTDDEGSGIRVELIPKISTNQFDLLIQYRAWDGERYVQTNNGFSLAKLYQFKLIVDVDNNLIINLDNQTILKEKISKQDIRYKKFVLGAGLSSSRIFVGEIANARMNLEVYKRDTIVPIYIFLLLVGLTLIAYVVFSNKLQIQRMSFRRLLKDLLAISVASTFVMQMSFQKGFADFFGDDFLNIWPIRGSDPLTIFSESIGPMYRPITELIFLLRHELHGQNLASWELGSRFLLATFVFYLYYFCRRFIKLGTLMSVLFTLAYTTSVIFFASAFWWASNGTQHLVSQILTVYLLSLVFRSVNEEFNQSSLNRIIFCCLLLTLTSELFLPVLLFLPGFMLLIFSKLKKSSRSKTEKKKKKKKASKAKRHGSEHAPVIEKISIAPFFLILIAFFILRTYVVEINKIVAASSAANFDFTTFNLGLGASQFLKYLLSFFGIILGGNFYDLGAGNGIFKTFESYSYLLQISTGLLLSVNLVMMFLVFQALRKDRMIRGAPDFYLILSLVLTMGVGLIGPSLVPNYQQLRWIQLPFLFFLVALAVAGILMDSYRKFRFLLYVSLFSQITSNLLLLNINFGVAIW